jgi:hypothetical protein
MIQKLRKPFLAICYSMYLVCLFSTPALAGMIGTVTSHETADRGQRGEEISKIQRALETEIVKEKLKAYGLASDEIQAKLGELSDEQIHTLAQASDDVLAGGDGGEVIIAILLIILIVILILYLTGHRVVVK